MAPLASFYGIPKEPWLSLRTTALVHSSSRIVVGTDGKGFLSIHCLTNVLHDLTKLISLVFSQ